MFYRLFFFSTYQIGYVSLNVPIICPLNILKKRDDVYIYFPGSWIRHVYSREIQRHIFPLQA